MSTWKRIVIQSESDDDKVAATHPQHSKRVVSPANTWRPCFTNNLKNVPYCDLTKERRKKPRYKKKKKNSGQNKERNFEAGVHHPLSIGETIKMTKNPFKWHASEKNKNLQTNEKFEASRKHKSKANFNNLCREVLDPESMARKKSTKRKAKVDDSNEDNDDNSNELPDTPFQEGEGQAVQANPTVSTYMSTYDPADGLNLLGKPSSEEQRGRGLNEGSLRVPVPIGHVKIKEEPKTDLDLQTCPTTNPTPCRSSPHEESAATIQPVKVKKERISDNTNSDVPCTRTLDTRAAMDLGSHLERSIYAPLSSGLTWSKLMEPNNFPKMQETGTTLKDVASRKEKSERKQQRAPSTSTYSVSLGPPLSSRTENTAGSRAGDEDTNAVSNPPNGRKSPSSSLNRFLSGSATGGSSLLDLSKRTIPPAIRRVLASKYGLQKRNDESHPTGMVPNFNKSRSRFTVASKKDFSTEYAREPTDKMETDESVPSIVIEHERDADERKSVGYDRSQASPGFSRSPEPNLGAPRSKAGGEYGSGSLGLDNRESNSSPSAYLALDHRPTKDTSDQLKSHGLLDLGSHYGELIKDSSPPVPPRSASRSPRNFETAGSPGSQNPGEAMIELGSARRLKERRGSAHSRTEEPMIDLSSVELPKSPRSPSFKHLTFPTMLSQGNRPVQNYPLGPPTNRSLRPNSPALRGPRPPFGPRLNRSSSPDYRTPVGPMMDLGKLHKGSDFQGMISSRPSVSITSRALQEMPVRGIPKRRHSLDSQSLRVPEKRLCTTTSAVAAVHDQIPEVKKPDGGVKLNIGDLLQLEQEEQKYIKELTTVQGQLTEVRFKIQKMEQELETLQRSETNIKCRIDTVRAKRVRILKEAQDREGSEGTRGIHVDVTQNEDRSFEAAKRRDGDGEFNPERRVIYNRASPRSLTMYGSEILDDSSRNIETKRKGKIEEEYFGRDHKHSTTRRVELAEEAVVDRSGSYHGNRLPDDRHRAPSELVLPSNHTSSSRSLSVPLSIPQSRYPVTSGSGFSRNDRGREHLGKFGILDSDLGAFQENICDDVETQELSGVTDNGDGTLLARQQTFPRGHHSRKGSSLIVLEEVDSDYKVKDRDSARGLLFSGAAKQFLGCLEISSTTEEPLTEDDEGPKEVLAEKERESFASQLRCDHQKISSTVPTIEVTQADPVVDSSCEKEYVGHTDAVCFVLPYKGKLFSASADRTAKAFDLKTGECTATFLGHQQAVNCLQITSEGGCRDRLFTGSNDQTVRAYNVKKINEDVAANRTEVLGTHPLSSYIQSGACTHKFSFRGRVMCLHIAFGKLFVGLSSGFVAVIDLKTNKCIDQFNCHEPSRISCVSSASEGQRTLLCTGSFDSTISIRDQSSGLLLRTITDHKLTVLCMQVVENILFSGSADTVVQSHNINTGELVRSYTGHTMSVSGLQALGGVLVTSSLDRIIRCFDIKTGDLLQLYGGNRDMIFSLSVFSDMIYTGCRDGRLSGIKLDLRKYHCCQWDNCSLKFGLLSHLKQHVQDHVNQTISFDACLWEGCCHRFPRGNQLVVVQAAMEHIISHVPCTEK